MTNMAATKPEEVSISGEADGEAEMEWLAFNWMRDSTAEKHPFALAGPTGTGSSDGSKRCANDIRGLMRDTSNNVSYFILWAMRRTLPKTELL